MRDHNPTTICRKTGKLETLGDENICPGCGQKVLKPFEGDDDHRNFSSTAEMQGHMRYKGFNHYTSFHDEETGLPIPTHARKMKAYRCQLTREEMDTMLSTGIGFAGLGMYTMMYEYDEENEFTLEDLCELASNPPD